MILPNKSHKSVKTLDINLKNLPEEAINELENFYHYLIYKYGKNNEKEIQNIQQSIERLSWEMGDKKYNSRDDLYEL